ncbi:hypothetical protein GNI_013910 [Gregarina niphandrodes]|uniref:Uncharacterized protein n=1 Tax=Gregarina niphandrodes TaxID=110365 RepID=A0A023BCG8_GRENI|nr:hypothetical protein GNI_013910 [Gregarina niphandrodes]EZG83908.1 hypothetical protein GNI_013910 [Gregarina niphandrodes]|eukprot:XP_011128907.1 hypothetical protein GNI_013910 [Gregarina niphandrodes]
MNVETTEWGLEQSQVYQNKDRCEEEIEEPDIFGPFNQTCGRQSLTSVAALLIGDQNAGKTTLLHSLSNAKHSLSFLHIQSLIPFIQASFYNCRFCNFGAMEEEGINPLRACCDEGAFLDSDIARASLTLTKPDWLFLLEEVGLGGGGVPEEFLVNDFTRLSLIEFGGDHLDRLQHRPCASHPCPDRPCSERVFENTRVQEICANSLKLLQTKDLTSVAYFINGCTAAGVHDDSAADGPLRLKPDYCKDLRSRLQALQSWCPFLSALHVYVTRVPVQGCARLNDACILDSAFLDVLASVVGQTDADKYEYDLRVATSSPFYLEIRDTVTQLCRDALPHVKCTVCPFLLLDRTTHLPNPCSIYYFLSHTVRAALQLHRLGANSSDPELLLNLLRCIKNSRYYAPEDKLWIETLTWVDYQSICKIGTPRTVAYRTDHASHQSLRITPVITHHTSHYASHHLSHRPVTTA